MSIFVQNAYAQATEVASNPGFQGKITQFATYFWSQLPNWIVGVIFIFASFIIAKIASKIVVNKIALKLDEEHQEAELVAGRATYTVVLMVGVTVGLKIAGIDLTTLLAAVAFGIGFALRDLIMNFLAGIMILVQRQFKIGDFIQVGDQLGKVVGIQTRATILQALDGTKVIIPNSDLFTQKVISFTTNPTRRITLPVGVEYGTDLSLALKVCLKVMEDQSFVLKEPAPEALLVNFDNSSINIDMRFWLDSQDNWWNRRSQMMTALKSEFDRVGIGIPFPLRTIVYDKDAQAEWSQHESEYMGARQEYELSKQVAAEAEAGPGADAAVVDEPVADASEAPADGQDSEDPPQKFAPVAVPASE